MTGVFKHMTVSDRGGGQNTEKSVTYDTIRYIYVRSKADDMASLV